MGKYYYYFGALVLSALEVSAVPQDSKASGVTCLCPLLVTPVCGNDNKTYNNECQLLCKNQGNPKVRVECLTSCPCIGCFCATVWIPVCGSDGKTYGNACELGCHNKRLQVEGRQNVTRVSNGECPPRNVCGCPRNYDPVCGSDGSTYANPCILDCENTKREELGLSSITVLFTGECPYFKDCFCTAEFEPVCGSNNRTYGNECKLLCDRKPRDVLIVECRKRCPCDFGCICTKEYNPVCGSDGKTYGNPCMFDCENKRLSASGQKKIWQVSKGECPVNNCNCSREYIPVCGSNKKTYNNKCELACENRLRKPPVNVACGHACPCKYA